MHDSFKASRIVGKGPRHPDRPSCHRQTPLSRRLKPWSFRGKCEFYTKYQRAWWAAGDGAAWAAPAWPALLLPAHTAAPQLFLLYPMLHRTGVSTQAIVRAAEAGAQVGQPHGCSSAAAAWGSSLPLTQPCPCPPAGHDVAD